MKRVRIWNTLDFVFTLKRNEIEVDPAGMAISVVLVDPAGSEMPMEHRVDGRRVIVTWKGTEQRVLGEYLLKVYIDRYSERQRVIDFDAVELVERTKYENCHGRIY